MTQAGSAGLLRERAGATRVTNVELFFDLVYVFAVTQLSHHLLHLPTVAGALQTAVLLAMVWLAWAYTALVTNWRVVSWPRVAAIVILALLGLAAGSLSALALGLCATVVVLGVAVADHWAHR